MPDGAAGLTVDWTSPAGPCEQPSGPVRTIEPLIRKLASFLDGELDLDLQTTQERVSLTFAVGP